MQIKAISGHAGPVPGQDSSRDYAVAKLIDVTTCIGCKACEVACLEWNGYPFRETLFDNTYQTMPDTAWNYWNLIRFNDPGSDPNYTFADASASLTTGGLLVNFNRGVNVGVAAGVGKITSPTSEFFAVINQGTTRFNAVECTPHWPVACI